jgi:UDP-galactopyranose mutase
VISAGRLADYKYYNMDDAVANALTQFDVLLQSVPLANT